MLAILAEAIEGNPCAVGCSNMLGFEMTTAVVETAEAVDVPVLVGVSARRYALIRTPLLAPALLLTGHAAGPVVLHLDQPSRSKERTVRPALELGAPEILRTAPRLVNELRRRLFHSVVVLSFVGRC